MATPSIKYWTLLLLLASLFGAGCSSSSPFQAASDSSSTENLVAATGLAWSVTSPSYSLTLQPTWTAANGATIASQSIQYYSDGVCGSTSGAPVTLTTSATSASFTAADASTYSYKVTTKSSTGATVVSACSGALTTDTMACVRNRLTNAPYADGTGTALDPILICTATQLNAIGANSGDWSKNFKLATDIDLAAYTGTQFNMIGNDTINFTGVFDGNNHTISNFTISNSATDYTGLFAYVSGASSTIKNLTLTAADVTATLGSAEVGALVGHMTDGAISHCSVSGSIHQTNSTTTQKVGGMGGYLIDVTVTNATSIMTIKADNHGVYAGGLFGYVKGSTVSSSSFSGAFVAGNSTSITGGLIGYMQNSTVTQSFSTGAVRAVASNVIGGLVGSVSGTSNISKSYSTGAVVGNVFYAGGLIGGLNSDSGYGVTDSYAQGSLAGSSGAVGGLIGGVSTTGAIITHCYASGLVSTGSPKAGFVGDDNNGGVTYGVYTANIWDNLVNIMGANGTGPIAGMSGTMTAGMQDPTTFSGAGWSGATWNLTTSGIYLKLGWQP